MERLPKTDVNNHPRVNLSRCEAEAQLELKKKILKTANLNILPDKGERVRKQIKDLEELIDTLNLDEKRKVEKLKASGDNKNPFFISAKSKNIDGRSDNKQKTVDCDQEKSSIDVKKSIATAIKDKCSAVGKTSSNTILKFTATGTSFADLNPGSSKPDAAFQELVNSPSFKTYRQPDKTSGIKLTEAKPLFENFVKGKSHRTVYTTVQPESLASEETVQKLHHTLCTFPDDGIEGSEPDDLKTKLMRHQVKGLSWLVWRESQQPSGGILADDMGLGKTLTIISLLLKQKQNGNFLTEKGSKSTCGTLIVCIASIVHQWEKEISKHCKEGSMRVLLYHGPKRDRDVKAMRAYDVVLTTYHILVSEKKAKESGLFDLMWERVVLDEAHTIKNNATQTAKAVFDLRSHRRWCLTGTPIHNKFKDMYSLVKFLQFQPFDDEKKWKKLTSDDTPKSNERRNLLVKSILLRRTKEETDESGKPLIEMVKKTIAVLHLDLSPEEMSMYDTLNSKVGEILRRYEQKPLAKIKTSMMLVLLLRLQQCCGHLSLLGKDTEEEANPDDSISNLSLNLSSLDIQDSGSESSLNLSLSEFQTTDISDSRVKSTKIKRLFEMLDEISLKSNDTDKSVIVSQWVSMLDIVAYHLKQSNISFHTIAGSTKPEDRQKASEDFNSNPDGHKIMLLSLKAGGVGLNLIGGNHLFLLDLHWNPALEMQACDRIHRVGQVKEVKIYKFVCRDTIEMKILSMQEEKSTIASDALHGAGKFTKGLSIQDFRTLFNVNV